MKNNKLAQWSVIGLIVLAVAVVSFSKETTALSGLDFVSKYQNTPNAVLIDVRTPQEFSSGHLDGAINIDFQSPTFTSDVRSLDIKKPYFIYCRSGNRSAAAFESMKKEGITTIYQLQGGVIAHASSLELVTVDSLEYVVDQSDMLDDRVLASTVEKPILSNLEIAGLVQMREEEKLARDVYTTLGSTWNIKVFSNIAASEQTHSNAVKALLVKYTIADPVKNDGVGIFTSKTMQDLYDKLVAQGKKSPAEALIVGATIEDLDIRDLDTLKQQTTNQDILSTYSNLQKGSRNHMRAFVKNITSRGGTYVPQYISLAAYTAIISAEQERGR